MQGNASQKDLLGSKGANLAEMCKIGIPVPPGFTISTEVCGQYYQNEKKLPEFIFSEIQDFIDLVEKQVQKKLGDLENPLLFSVRSGSRFSMPGMMDTILNVGLTKSIVLHAKNFTEDRKIFLCDSYRRLLQMYAEVVLQLGKSEFIKATKNKICSTAEETLQVCLEIEDQIYKQSGQKFPQNPCEQIFRSIEAVFRSWMNKRAVFYRKLHGFSDSLGTAVNIQSMVFGNANAKSGTGVLFTRNPSTGKKELHGEFITKAQGEDIVSGAITPQPIINTENPSASINSVVPGMLEKLQNVSNTLEAHFKDMQDVEFTIENGTLWILQTRSAKRTGVAAIKVAHDLATEGILSQNDALLQIDPYCVDQILHPKVCESYIDKSIAKGLAASPGAVSGIVVFSSERAIELSQKNISTILVREETCPEDIAGMHASVGILTSKGGVTSHAAVVARGMGKPCICGTESLHIDETKKTLYIANHSIEEGQEITIDGTTGQIFKGKIPTIFTGFSSEFKKVISWADDTRTLKIRANAETQRDVQVALNFGAQGIGLCRTEHMFFEEDRIHSVRKMILAESDSIRNDILETIRPMQKHDFTKIFRLMSGLPVTIRLLDPPLHEFLPTKKSELLAFCEFSGMSMQFTQRRILDLREFNPMLGHRGCRLGITYSQIYRMQILAMLEAYKQVYDSSTSQTSCVLLELLFPLISCGEEIKFLKNLALSVAKEFEEKEKFCVPFKIGSMIETPRAAICSEEIAPHVDFISFGTNDLTQLSWGISRDDSAPFISQYLEKKILLDDPFIQLERAGVGELMKICIEKSKKSNPEIHISVCGEHGGDPRSIEFIHSIGVHTISCSPFRIPTAKIAASRAAILHPL